jgi:putative DNA primase/helicase
MDTLKKEKGTEKEPQQHNTFSTNIGIAEILEEVTSIKGSFKNTPTIEPNKILDELLSKVKKVNFREYTNLTDEKEKLQKKHFLVVTIELLLKTAKENNFDLCRKNEVIYLFNSEYWKSIDNEVFKDFLGKVALKLGVQKYDAKVHTFRDELFKQFLADASLKEIKSSNTTTLINLKNGTFEITPKKQILREFRQSDFITYQLPFSYNKDEKAPLFQTFLNRVLPEKELQNILAEYLGSVFVKSQVLKLEKVLLLYGSGANGKSVVFEIIKSLLGEDNITSNALQSLTKNDSYCRALLSNKLLNYASEINGKLEAQTFKQLASGEPIEVNVKYKNPYIMTDYAKLMFNTNELPKQVENTPAFFRRFIILPFKVTIPENEQDKELSNKIIEKELSGVFNWVLDGLQRLLNHKSFTESEIAKEEILQFRKESDSVLMFLAENNYIKSSTNRINRTELYQKYQQHCIEFGNKPVSQSNFYKRLENSGYSTTKSNGIRYIYIDNE